MSFHVGQEVVVVASWADLLKGAWHAFRREGEWPPLLRPKRVHVVVAVVIRSQRTYLRVNGASGWDYASRYFRPVVKFKNDISELQAILDRVNRREAIDA